MPQLVFVLTRLNRKGGQELSTLEVLLRLQKKGWRIQVISYVLEDWPGEPLDWERVPCYFLPTHWLRDLWLGIYSWWLLRSKKYKNSLRLTVGVASWSADVRVVQFQHSQLRKLVVSGIAKFPNAETGIRWLYQNLYSLWNSWLEQRLFTQTPLIVAISRSVASQLRTGVGKNRENIEVIHHAPGMFSEIKAPSKGPNGRGESDVAQRDISFPVRILFVGALERKGIAKALRVLAHLTEENWCFDVVGDGDIPRWQALAQNLGIGERVKFHGPQPSADYFSRANVFLFPSLYEPFGLVISEAVTAGLVVVAAAECGAMELWPNRLPELDLSNQDPDVRWAHCLRRILREPEWRREIVKSEQEQFFRWNWDLATDEYDRVLRGALRSLEVRP